ncbi:hypothetical protein CCMA1212_008535 [Trichoderma ghanense]|uniref:Uncharacterized protein n=1 Tax=Trichoderma ghanense TaxID=65468 RepID=A0ABY2GWM6_9HYPO
MSNNIVWRDCRKSATWAKFVFVAVPYPDKVKVLCHQMQPLFGSVDIANLTSDYRSHHLTTDCRPPVPMSMLR